MQKPLLQKLANPSQPQPQPLSWDKLKRGLKAQYEGFYKLNPTHSPSALAAGATGHPYGEVVPGVSKQSLPQAVRGFAKSPLSALSKSWQAMGPGKAPIVGVGKQTGKLLPKLIRSTGAKVPAGYPSVGRLLFAGYTLNKLQKLLTEKDRKGERLGNLIGSTGGWLLGSRLPLLPSVGAWMGAEALGGGLGKLYDKHVSGEGQKNGV